MVGESVSHFYLLPDSVEFAATSLSSLLPSPSLFLQMACRMDVFDRAEKLGIQTEFVDGQGHRHVTDATALKIILDALPERIPARLVDGPVVIRTSETSRTELRRAAVLPVAWKVVAGREIIAQGETGQRTIAWPAGWQVGIYRLKLTDAAAFSEEVPLIVSPPRAYAGDFERGWLLAVQR
jgi:4-alpha-glucanotransferase